MSKKRLRKETEDDTASSQPFLKSLHDPSEDNKYDRGSPFRHTYLELLSDFNLNENFP